jgi:hypothetical protein
MFGWGKRIVRRKGTDHLGIRESLNEKPQIAYGVAGGLVLLALIIIAFQFIGRSTPGPINPAGADQAYFSDDDGASYFPDDRMKIPPFSRNGKLAYSAHVFRCGSDKPFVGYLGKFTDVRKKEIEAAVKAGQLSPRMLRASMGQMLIKKPGTSKWVSPEDASTYEQIQTVTCPNGGVPEGVTPANP